MKNDTKIYLNIGCGDKPIDGFVNYDGSPSVLLAKRLPLASALRRLRLIGSHQMNFIRFCAAHDIGYARVNALPVADESVAGIYACHVFEHLDERQRDKFLKECYRGLKSGGWVRIVIPDLKMLVDQYLKDGDADRLVTETRLAMIWSEMHSLRGRIQAATVGYPCCHKWMYDGRSLSRHLEAAGFRSASILQSGETTIKDTVDINWRERELDSVYVEAWKP